MTEIWLGFNADSGVGPLHGRVKRFIRSLIDGGQLKPLDILPPDKELAGLLGVSHVTLIRAFRELRQEGWVSRKPRYGTVVQDPRDIIVSGWGTAERTVGLIFDDISHDTFSTDLFLSLFSELRHKNYAVTLFSAKSDQKLQLRIATELSRSGQVCGAIIWPCLEPAQAKKLISEKPESFPLVFLDKKYPEVKHDFVGYDDFAAGLAVGRQFLKEGMKRIVFFKNDYIQSSMTSKDRLKGVKAAIAENSSHDISLSVEAVDDTVSGFVPRNPVPLTGFLCTSSAQLPLLSEALAEEDRNSRESCRIACIGPLSSSESLERLDLEYRNSHRLSGRVAVETLLERLNDPQGPMREVRLPGELVIHKPCSRSMVMK